MLACVSCVSEHRVMGQGTPVDRSNREQGLIDAIKRGDENRVRGLVYEDERLANASDGKVPAVLLAMHHGHRGIAQALVDLGADVDVFTAAALNNPTRLAMSLRGQLNLVNAHNSEGWTPLGLAARFGAIAAARLLLSLGADPTIPAADGQTPLQIAENEGKTAVVEMLRRVTGNG